MSILNFDVPFSPIDSVFDFEDFNVTTEWDTKPEPICDLFPNFEPHLSHFEPHLSHFEPHLSHFEPHLSHFEPSLSAEPNLSPNLSPHWINDPASSPIPIPQPAFEQFLFPQDASFSPSDFALSSDDPYSPRAASISPIDTTFSWPCSPRVLRSSSSSRPSVRHSPMLDTTVRQRNPSLRGPVASPLLFTSTSAPTSAESRLTRSYSRSVGATDDPDAPLKRKKRSPPVEDRSNAEPVLKSVLRPPKLAPSAWQLYFTDWIQNQQVSGTRKLNVAQAAKEAGQEYASLTEEEKEPYKRRSQAAKEARERELTAYMRSLTPDDIKRENAFRAAQRKAGKSRKSNIKDPNAPKKPLSAYFMFLQRIRASPQLVRDIFGDETETTKQSVLAAAKWRSMSDAERQPFLAQAEQEKMEYEAARRMYEEGSPNYASSNINFSILPGSPLFPSMKIESESESEGYDNTVHS
ncbi:Mismatch-binding protein cmb1 [Termitomyces sp. J132]|nr:Mismatch-binding protein cmb1 [Termitomyces sp. J132]